MGAVSRAGAQKARPEGQTNKAQRKGTSVSDSEFYANATLGYRQWYFSLKSGENTSPFLEGLHKHDFYQPRYRWDLKGPNYAECLPLKFHSNASFSEAHGEVPKAGCSCGFYAHGRGDASNSESTVHMVGGVVAGWGKLELHERGFKCGAAKILAVFAPDPRRMRPPYGELARKNWAALKSMCAGTDILMLSPDALSDDAEVRRYTRARDLILLEEQLVT
ncbi:MAG: hypothetical protein AVDCRST_MAG14-391 [uncultured Rubrobacteraceae bacterium]|uniref:Uncharacterized protein n=1 Tax=uncultured Rubrobacteraceae bacterium TaxID=349277 RepID=A0A6J4QLS4_9ACTN|nr:MAG: hypothetical protein AVDCRST_MAG14-391 [uncultured Rubrobacteraceae bacterium]